MISDGFESDRVGAGLDVNSQFSPAFSVSPPVKTDNDEEADYRYRNYFDG